MSGETEKKEPTAVGSFLFHGLSLKKRARIPARNFGARRITIFISSPFGFASAAALASGLCRQFMKRRRPAFLRALFFSACFLPAAVV